MSAFETRGTSRDRNGVCKFMQRCGHDRETDEIYVTPTENWDRFSLACRHVAHCTYVAMSIYRVRTHKVPATNSQLFYFKGVPPASTLAKCIMKRSLKSKNFPHVIHIRRAWFFAFASNSPTQRTRTGVMDMSDAQICRGLSFSAHVEANRRNLFRILDAK